MYGGKGNYTIKPSTPVLYNWKETVYRGRVYICKPIREKEKKNGKWRNYLSVKKLTFLDALEVHKAQNNSWEVDPSV